MTQITPVGTMIDKLILRANHEIDKKDLLSNLSDFNHELLRDPNYRDCIMLKRDESESLVVKSNPYFSHVRSLSIEINPAYWGSLPKISSLLSRFTFIDELEIARIDHAVDIDTPVSLLHNCLRVKFKRNWKNYKVEEGSSYQLNGFYLGREPETYCIYNKKAQMRKKGLESNIVGEKTRIEVRQIKRKLPFKSWNQLSSLLEYEPFKNLEFYDFSDLGQSSNKEVLELCLNNSGFSKAYSLLNRSNNFKRNFKKYIKPNNFKEHLHSIYWNNLGQLLTPKE